MQLPTGRALIQVDAAGNNSIVILHGANGSTTPVPDLRIVLPLPDSHGYTHVVLQNEVPLSVTTSTLRDARAAGIVTLFNPSPLLSTSAAAAFDWTLVDYLVINEHEAQALLVGYEAGGVICRDHISGSRATGACATIVTHGAAGYTLCIDEDISSYPAPKAHAVDSTGAGDCFLVSPSRDGSGADAARAISLRVSHGVDDGKRRGRSFWRRSRSRAQQRR